jgi:hypothetical protein
MVLPVKRSRRILTKFTYSGEQCTWGIIAVPMLRWVVCQVHWLEFCRLDHISYENIAAIYFHVGREFARWLPGVLQGKLAKWLVTCTPDREIGVRIKALPHGPTHNIVGQGVNSQVPRLTKPFILRGSMNWYTNFGWGVNVLCALYWGGVWLDELPRAGAMRLNRRIGHALCTPLHSSFLPANL